MEIPAGFTEWKGGEEPARRAIVEVIERGGDRLCGYAQQFCWEGDAGDMDIVAYRLVEFPTNPYTPKVWYAMADGRRERFALKAYEIGLKWTYENDGMATENEMAISAVKHADALISELDKK